MRLFLFILPFLCSFAQAQNYAAIYQHLSALQQSIYASLTAPEKPEAPDLANISFSYVEGVGGYFQLDFVQPFVQWQQQQHDDSVPQDAATSPVLLQQKQAFNELRLTARQLSHRSYDLERQIKSLQQAAQQSNGQARQELQRRIAEAQQQLSQFEAQKRQLKPQYQSLQRSLLLQETSDGSEPVGPEAFLHYFAWQLAQQLCQGSQGSRLLPDKDNMTFILKQMAPMNGQRYPDRIYRFRVADITACIEDNGAPQQLLKQALQRDF